MNKVELIEKIIDENRLINRKKADENSCPCYNGTRCHNDTSDYEMICLLCVCPEYDRSPNNLEGGCKIDNPQGKWFYHRDLPEGKIWDCSDCGTPHTEEYVKGYLEKLSIPGLNQIREHKTINDLWKFFNREVSQE